MERFKNEESHSTAQLEKDLSIQRISMKKLLDRQMKQDSDYYEAKINVTRYNRLSETLEAEISEHKNIVAYLEREIEKLQAKVNINKELIVEALTNFDNLLIQQAMKRKRR